ncbi:unnamed protein product [Linum tenue]|uniref:Fungal lipase-type domain-containing protein n=1 Tax=Linum tenue TaxID=586396 RepID=A0AAV0RUS3_9ROSI|nr:unnamed protein product [Linum tenue]
MYDILLDSNFCRYLLAEAGDTLFASFIGTKQYKDVVADVNIFQGAIFQEDATQDTASIVTADFGKVERPKASGEHDKIAVESKSRQQKDQPKPAAHRGFLARAKGIPALELYKLAQKKNRKLVLCGHSLGGAVAALATLAILRVIAASSPSKEHENVQVKCITFSQPPVGNAALRDYVHEKGWQHHFKTYCIPEDIVPRFLSPAYFIITMHSLHQGVLRSMLLLYLLENSSVELLSGAEYSKLTSWLGLAAAGTVTLAQIVESPVIRTATSFFLLDGVVLLVRRMCSTTVESFPSAPTYSSTQGKQPELQKIRVLVGAPLRRPPIVAAADSLMPLFSSINSDVNLNGEHSFRHQEKALRPEALLDFSIFCTSDFTTVTKEVHVRTRRVRYLAWRITAITNSDNMLMEADVQEGIAGGLCYCDSSGVNLQDLNMEVSRFRDELWTGIRDLSRKVDLIVLVHNLSHKIPRSISDPTTLQQQPVLGFLLEEAKALGIPWVLAITNKFSVSAHQQKAAIDAVLQAYQASPSSTEVINSCPPFQRRDTVIPVDGVSSLCQLVQRVLQSKHEEAALEELARDRLLAELVREQALGASGGSEAKESSMTAAAVGASVGAGLGLVLAVVMGAASALRKP